jgi:hypothetical protein
MADASTWTRAHPSGASLLRDFDDLHRSDKSIFEASFLEEHYWKDGSAASAGEHKLGSARIYSGASSAISSSGQSGRLMWDETNLQLVALHVATTTRIPSLVANNTWSGTQTFSAAVTCSSTLGVIGATTLSSTLAVGDTLTAQSTVGPARFALDVSEKATLEGANGTVWNILTAAKSGLLICTNTNVGGSALFLVDATDNGVVFIAKIGGSVTWSATKDTAGAQNVYIELGVLKHQNNSAGYRQTRFMFLRTR